MKPIHMCLWVAAFADVPSRSIVHDYCRHDWHDIHPLDIAVVRRSFGKHAIGNYSASHVINSLTNCFSRLEIWLTQITRAQRLLLRCKIYKASTVFVEMRIDFQAAYLQSAQVQAL